VATAQLHTFEHTARGRTHCLKKTLPSSEGHGWIYLSPPAKPRVRRMPLPSTPGFFRAVCQQSPLLRTSDPSYSFARKGNLLGRGLNVPRGGHGSLHFVADETDSLTTVWQTSASPWRTWQVRISWADTFILCARPRSLIMPGSTLSGDLQCLRRWIRAFPNLQANDLGSDKCRTIRRDRGGGEAFSAHAFRSHAALTGRAWWGRSVGEFLFVHSVPWTNICFGHRPFCWQRWGIPVRRCQEDFQGRGTTGLESARYQMCGQRGA